MSALPQASWLLIVIQWVENLTEVVHRAGIQVPLNQGKKMIAKQFRWPDRSVGWDAVGGGEVVRRGGG